MSIRLTIENTVSMILKKGYVNSMRTSRGSMHEVVKDSCQGEIGIGRDRLAPKSLHLRLDKVFF